MQAKTLREANGMINRAYRVYANVLLKNDVHYIEVSKKAAKDFLSHIVFTECEVNMESSGSVYISN